MKKILVLCTGNSCRSQIAEGFLNHFGNGKAEVHSAGIEAHGVNPKAIQVMKEIGIDISHHTSKTIEKYLAQNFDFVITVCDNAKENCPYFPGNAKKLHRNFPDPAKAKGTEDEILNEFRKTRDLIKEFCKKFAEDFIQ